MHRSAVFWISCDGPEVGDLEIGGTLDCCRDGECRAGGQNNGSDDGLHFGWTLCEDASVSRYLRVRDDVCC